MKSNYVAKQSHGVNRLLFYFYPRNEKIDSAAVCGFLFRDPVGHVQDMLFLTPVCLHKYCDEVPNLDELDGK